MFSFSFFTKNMPWQNPGFAQVFNFFAQYCSLFGTQRYSVHPHIMTYLSSIFNNKEVVLSFRGMWSFASKNIPNNRKCNHCNSKRDLSQINLRSKINHVSSNISSTLTAKYQATTLYIKFSIIVNGSRVAKIRINQAAVRLEKIAENTFSLGIVKNFSIKLLYHNYLFILSQQSKLSFILINLIYLILWGTI